MLERKKIVEELNAYPEIAGRLLMIIAERESVHFGFNEGTLRRIYLN